MQRLIAEEKMTFKLSSLASEYNVTERSLRNDIQEINDFLRVQAVERLTFDVEGHIERPHNFNALELEQAIYNMGAYDYKFSGDERQIYIITTLLMNDGITTMQTLAENL
ncbi:MAG: HTH domain-containing protein, partial [Selenomonadaceae bacterium]|nr:HTH domain-containing protein [Selenomonadaceae bacterium]